MVRGKVAPEEQEAAYRTFPLRPVWQPQSEWARLRGEAQGVAWEMGLRFRGLALRRPFGGRVYRLAGRLERQSLCRCLCRNPGIPFQHVVQALPF
jgi:hypothetical protein